MFLIALNADKTLSITGNCFNPLNQVYVFNNAVLFPLILFIPMESFNPLNQVYVFNYVLSSKTSQLPYDGFNPLNQVYVFN